MISKRNILARLDYLEIQIMDLEDEIDELKVNKKKASKNALKK